MDPHACRPRRAWDERPAPWQMRQRITAFHPIWLSPHAEAGGASAARRRGADLHKQVYGNGGFESDRQCLSKAKRRHALSSNHLDSAAQMRREEFAGDINQ